MEYIIEKDIEIMKVKACRKYPFGEMQVGDSFIICETYSRALMGKFYNAGNNYGKLQDPRKEFSTRKVNGQIRIWRIA